MTTIKKSSRNKREKKSVSLDKELSSYLVRRKKFVESIEGTTTAETWKKSRVTYSPHIWSCLLIWKLGGVYELQLWRNLVRCVNAVSFRRLIAPYVRVIDSFSCLKSLKLSWFENESFSRCFYDGTCEEVSVFSACTCLFRSQSEGAGIGVVRRAVPCDVRSFAQGERNSREKRR